MASVTGITAAKALDILGQSVVSGAINGFGHLILTRDNGQTIDAGDFTAIVTGLMHDDVVAEVAAQDIPGQVATKVAGTRTSMGSISYLDLSGVSADNLVNALYSFTLSGNMTFTTAELPAAPKQGTQFMMRIAQDATGGRTLTLTGIKKSNGVLTLSTAPNAIDIIVFMYEGTTWYAGAMGLAFS